MAAGTIAQARMAAIAASIPTSSATPDATLARMFGIHEPVSVAS